MSVPLTLLTILTRSSITRATWTSAATVSLTLPLATLRSTSLAVTLPLTLAWLTLTLCWPTATALPITLARTSVTLTAALPLCGPNLPLTLWPGSLTNQLIVGATSFLTATLWSTTSTTCLTTMTIMLMAMPIATFGTRFDHGQRNPTTFFVDGHHPRLDDVTHQYHIMRIFDEVARELADVDQAGFFQADVDEGTEIDHVEDVAHEHHARRQIFQLEHTGPENRWWQIFTRITTWTSKVRQDVRHDGLLKRELTRDIISFRRHAFLTQRFNLGAIVQHARLET